MWSRFLTVMLLCWGAESFPDGAPIDACVKDRPNQPNHGQHRTQPLSTLPYRVIASATNYGPNTPITGKSLYSLLNTLSQIDNLLILLTVPYRVWVKKTAILNK